MLKLKGPNSKRVMTMVLMKIKMEMTKKRGGKEENLKGFMIMLMMRVLMRIKMKKMEIIEKKMRLKIGNIKEKNYLVFLKKTMRQSMK